MMEKYLLEYMVTSPHVNKIGYYHLPVSYIACDTNARTEDVEVAILGLANKGFISYDKTNSVVAIAQFSRYEDVEPGSVRNIKFAFLPMSGVFKTTFGWMEKTLSSFEIEAIKKNPWVKEAVKMDSPSIQANCEPCGTEETAKEAVMPTNGDAVSDNNKTVGDAKSEAEGNEEASEAKMGSAENDSTQDLANEQETATEESGSANENPEAEKKPSRRKKTPSDDPVLRQHTEEFEALWKKFPRKADKNAALNGYLSMINSGELTFSVASRAIDNYIYQCKKDGTEEKYLLGGRSFFGKNSKRILEFVEEEAPSNNEEKDKELMKELAPKFKMFWLVYPKKVGMELAEQHFCELVRSGEFSVAQLQEAATAYASECQAKNTEDRYIKRADSFLDPTTRPFRDYIGREDLSRYSVNLHTGDVDEGASEEDDLKQMEAMLGKESASIEDAVAGIAENEPAKEKSSAEQEEETIDIVGDDEQEQSEQEEQGEEEAASVKPSIPSYDEDEEDKAASLTSESGDLGFDMPDEPFWEPAPEGDEDSNSDFIF